MLYIVAGNNNEYRNWVATQTRCHPDDTRYVDNADQIRGLRIIEGLFIGTCYDRIDITKIVDYINVIRSKTAKPLIRLNDLINLSRYTATDHTFLNTTVPNWSQNNIPVANGGTSQAYPSRQMGKTATTGAIATTLGPAYNNTSSTLVGKTYDKVILDEFEKINSVHASIHKPSVPHYNYTPPSSYKVPLPAIKVDAHTLITAKMYSSYITNDANPITNEYDYYFSHKGDATDFAKAYDSQALAYEYK